MQVSVDGGRCQGHTLCHLVAPQLFGLNDQDGHAYVLLDPVPPALAAQARQAAAGCPEEAITVVE
jgi:ferredoxin